MRTMTERTQPTMLTQGAVARHPPQTGEVETPRPQAHLLPPPNPVALAPHCSLTPWRLGQSVEVMLSALYPLGIAMRMQIWRRARSRPR